MKLGESFVVALRSLTVNRLRTALTMLGIIIGVGAVIALVSAGQGAERLVSGQINSMGSNIILVTPASSATVLGLSDADFILDKVSSITRAMPVIQVNTQVAWKGASVTVGIQGVTEEFPEIRSFHPETGRFLIQTDILNRRRVAVLGQTVLRDLFEGQDPIGETVTIAGQSFTVVGVMEVKGEAFGTDMDNVVFVPVTTLQRVAGTTRVSAIYAQIADREDADQAVDAISRAFDARFRRQRSVNVASQKQLLDVVATVTTTFTVLLASIAAISLLVGGIGIMNIMLVSVTERTKEIGLRKALGAKNRDILLQFLIEASILSGTGGVIGIFLGSAATRLISRLGGWLPYTSPSAVGMAFGFSIMVGVFFGFYPAARASRLDPISCLRYE
ncbi:MAG TPA: FtsX-like permease family protein [Firmicutes bacterium]|nr:FtsX-like permease family protein [Candidatus Fermentithermobacillaceae bacterium]